MTTTTLLRTPLYDLHSSLEAKMVPFAGYEMPVQFRDGILKEHNHTRAAAGLFDVSHMGQIRLSGAQAAEALESLVPVDIMDLEVGQQRYALFTNEEGGVLDDLMVANLGEALLLVVNAACKSQDLAHIQKHLSDRCQIELLQDRALLAIQGPQAAASLSAVMPGVETMLFMQCREIDWSGQSCIVSRSGYTGEDGFEISVPADSAESLARSLLAQDGVSCIGLGARDSLRLEAGLCLYGHDLDKDHTPVESSLLWALSRVRRDGGDRAGGYPGASVIARQLAEGTAVRRVGLLAVGKAPIRGGSVLKLHNGQTVGEVTSGGFGPTYGAPVAMGYVDSSLTTVGTALYAEVRGRMLAVEVAKMPFVQQRYYRG